MPSFLHDGIRFEYLERSSGVPVIFQHGMGGNAERVVQPLISPAFRLLSFDFRGHGKTPAIGSIEKLSFDAFADDLIAFMDFLDLEQAVIGGNSMGAGVSLNVALRYPARVKALVLLRPAWLDDPHPENLKVYTTIMTLMRQHGAEKGKALFEASELYQSIKQDSEHAATTLMAEFAVLNVTEQFAIRESFVAQAPIKSLESLQHIKVPTLVLGQQRDHTHPLEFAQRIAAAIPRAQFKQLTSNAINPEQYARDLQQAVNQFVKDID